MCARSWCALFLYGCGYHCYIITHKLSYSGQGLMQLQLANNVRTQLVRASLLAWVYLMIGSDLKEGYR